MKVNSVKKTILPETEIIKNPTIIENQTTM